MGDGRGYRRGRLGALGPTWVLRAGFLEDLITKPSLGREVRVGAVTECGWSAPGNGKCGSEGGNRLSQQHHGSKPKQAIVGRVQREAGEVQGELRPCPLGDGEPLRPSHTGFRSLW